MSQESHGWANPGPAGLVGLAVACFTFYAVLCGKVDHVSALPLLGIWLIGGFFVQLVVAIIELNHGNVVGGNVFLYFSAYFMLVGGFEMLMKWYCIQHNIPFDGKIDGWAWIVLSGALTLWAPGYLASPKSLFFAVVALIPAVWLVAFKDLGILPNVGPAAGWLLLIVGILGLYTSAGVVLNTKFGRNVIPMGDPIIKA